MNMGHNMRPIDPDRIRYELEQTGEAWADAHAAASLLEETQKSVLSELVADYQGSGVKAVAAAEHLARADRRYRQHVAEMVSARKAANKARVKMDSLKAWIELERTRASTDRALMGLR